jgi:hypothetical protein
VKAAGSTSIGAFPRMFILNGGFGKAHSEANPFVWFYMLIYVESHKNPKKIPP